MSGNRGNTLDTFGKGDGHFAPKDKMDVRFSELIHPLSVVEEMGLEKYIAAFLIGVPSDAAVKGRPGAARGPGAIRGAFRTLSSYDIELEHDLSRYIMADLGDVKPGPSSEDTNRRVREAVSRVVAKYWSPNGDGCPILMLGGDHSLTAPGVQGAAASGRCLGVINLDAHLDVREYSGPFSSGSPFRFLLETGTLEPRHFVEVGMHSFANSAQYVRWTKEEGILIIPLKEIRASGVDSTVNKILKHLGDEVDQIYVSVDLDGVCGTLLPGVSAPSVGGFLPGEIVSLLRKLCFDPRVMMVDFMELSPPHDMKDISARFAAWLAASAFSALSFRGKRK